MTEGSEWNNTSESSKSKTTEQNYQKAIEHAQQTTNESSVTNSSSVSSGSGSSGSKKKKNNTRTGTTTPQKIVDEAADEVERILKLPNTDYVPTNYRNLGSHAFYAYALDKLTKYLDSGKISKTDYERIANQTGLDKYR